MNHFAIGICNRKPVIRKFVTRTMRAVKSELREIILILIISVYNTLYLRLLSGIYGKSAVKEHMLGFSPGISESFLEILV